MVYWLNILFGRLRVSFIDKDGEKHTFEVSKGDNLLDIAQANDLEMEGESSTKPVEPRRGS